MGIRKGIKKALQSGDQSTTSPPQDVSHKVLSAHYGGGTAGLSNETHYHPRPAAAPVHSGLRANSETDKDIIQGTVKGTASHEKAHAAGISTSAGAWTASLIRHAPAPGSTPASHSSSTGQASGAVPAKSGGGPSWSSVAIGTAVTACAAAAYAAPGYTALAATTGFVASTVIRHFTTTTVAEIEAGAKTAQHKAQAEAEAFQRAMDDRREARQHELLVGSFRFTSDRALPARRLMGLIEDGSDAESD